VKIIKLFPLFLCLLFSIIFYACEIDPWTQRGNRVDTDMVVIKKITAYGKQVDGVQYKGNVGAVTMSHNVHGQHGIQCIDCHHKNNNDDRIKECARCHSGDKGYNTMHGLCVDCHISKNKGPQKCMECH
jgi:hypothetical protein